MTTAGKAYPPGIVQKKKGFWNTLSKQWQLAVMSVPMLLYVFLFNYAPLWGWITAFQDYKPKQGIFGSKWVGLGNFTFLFGREDFLLSIRNTLAMSVINLVFGTCAAILLAAGSPMPRGTPYSMHRAVISDRQIWAGLSETRGETT